MTNNKKIYISLTALGFLTVILIAFFICPLFKEIKRGSAELVSQKENLVSLEVKIKNIKEFEALYPDLKPNLEKIDALFVDREVPVEFISFLEKLSADCGLDFSLSLGSQKKAAEDPRLSLNFQINLDGTFLNLSKFLEKLESSPYLIEIQEIAVNKLERAGVKKEAEESAVSNVKAALSVKVYTK